MTTWARVKNNMTGEVEVITSDPFGHYTPNIASQFFICPDNISSGSTYLNGIFTSPTGDKTIFPPPSPPFNPPVFPTEAELTTIAHSTYLKILSGKAVALSNKGKSGQALRLVFIAQRMIANV